MSDSEDEEMRQIREQKRERLREQQGAGESGGETGTETPDEPVALSGTADLEAFVSEHRVALIDCYADWCGPCKMMEPVVEGLAESTDAAIGKVDVDQNQEIAGQLGARSIPTFVLFVDGEPTEQLVGAQDESTFEQLISQA